MKFVARVFRLAMMLALLPVAAGAQTIVNTEAELRSAIAAAVPGSTIVFGANITLTADLPSIGISLVIDGSGHTLSGGDLYRGLLVGAISDFSSSPIDVTVQNISITNTLAQGGSGGSGASGGGGGAGLGGALFVATQANVTLKDVSFTANQAIGGTGGAVDATALNASGGGGGLGGNGASGVTGSAGGGGGVGVGANGGTNAAGSTGTLVTADPGGSSGIFPGGLNGGGGAATGQGAGGGGDAGGGGFSGTAGTGGYGGGGGGGQGGLDGGLGGLGGGGGGGGTAFGFGGYGGGGGGNDRGAIAAPGGFGGGNGGGNAAPGGGGGAGMGGGIFVESGGTITISGSVRINGNTVAGGSGSGAGTNGSAYGAGMFIGGGTVIFTNAAGETTTIADTIGDEFGSSGIIDVGSASLRKMGAGTLVLMGANQLTGATFIDGGTVRVNGASALGTGSIFIADSARLAVTANTTMAQGINVAGNTAIDAAVGQTVALSGPIQDTFSASVPVAGAIAFGGGGTISLGNTTNSYSGGSSIAGNTTVVIGDDGALGQAATAVGLGDGASAGTLSFTSGSLFTSGRGVTINAGGGTVNTSGTAAVTLSAGLSGSGTFTKSGTGTLVLGGSTSHNGNSVIADGTLRAGTSGALSTGAMQIGATATLDLNNFSQSVGSLAGGGLVSLGSATLIVGSDNTSTSFAGVITGSGTLVKFGSGVQTLTGANTYTGGTIVSSGALVGTTSSLQGDIQDFAAVGFDQNTNGTYAGQITGSGALTKSGAGTVALTGINSYGGGTTVNAGVLAGDTTSVQGNILNNAAVQFIQPGNGFFTGSMSGTGRLVKSGIGTLTITGLNTYSGGTLIAGGTLAGDSTSIQGNIQNDANLLFDQNTNGTYAGTLFGTGAVTKAGSGTLTLTGTSAYTGGTTISGGLLIGNSQSLQGNITNNASLLFNQVTDGIYTGSITGTGNLSKSGGGMLVLNGTNVYTGGTSVQSGGLQGTTLSLQGNISNSGQVIFSQNVNGTYTGSMFGTGALVKEGTGVVTLTGSNTYTGGTTVNGGTLSGTTTSLQGAMANNAVVEFNQAANGVYGGVMSGTGALVKSGTGTLTLTGANSYSGGTLVSSGTLAGDASTIQGNVQNDASLVFNQNTDGSFGGTMAGTGALTKNGTGTLTLTGQSSFTGVTTINAGTLAVNSASLPGNVVNNAALRFDQLFDGLFSGNISGSGNLVKNGTGILVLGGTSTYTGGTSILAGGLMGTTSNLQGNFVNNGQIIFSQATNGTFAGGVSGTGSVVKAGAGILTIAGNNTYTGGTFITGGGVSIASDASLGSNGSSVSLGGATANGSMIFTNSNLLSSLRGFSLGAGGGVFDTAGAQVTLFGPVTGAGGLTKNGIGVLELAGSGSYLGSTIVNAGTLRTGANGALGAGSLFLAGGAAVDVGNFNQTVGSIAGGGNLLLGTGSLTTGGDGSSSLFSGVISGSGRLVKTGGGTLALTAANAYSGGTSVLGGALVGNTTSLQGNILNNAVVLFDQNNNGIYAGSMSGSGALAKSGSGVLTLAGNNTYTGGTIITGGSVTGSANSLRGAIVNNASLTFGGAADGAFFGSISGSGTLSKLGAGQLSLNGAQPLTGLFSIQEGEVALNGTYGGSVTILPGASLRANGFIAGSVNLAGSLFAVSPGSAFVPSGLQAGGASATTGDNIDGPSYLSIGQNLTATNGSLFNFAIGPGSNPTVLVGGTASLNGARFEITAPAIGQARATSFLALAALNGLSVQNTDVITSDAGVLPSLTLNRNALFVTLLNLNVPLASVAGSPAAAALDRSKFAATGDAAFVIKELTALDNDKLRDALEQIAGELHASVMHTAIIDSETITDLIRDQLSVRQLDDKDDFRWWGETACQRADFDGTDKSKPGHATICAGAGGVDRRLSEKWTVGGGGSFTGGNMGVDGGGKGDYQAPRAFGYAGFKPNWFGFRGGGSAAKSNYKTKRQINFEAVLPPELGGQPLSQGVHREAEAEQDGSSADGWSEISDTRKFSGYTLESMFGVRRARIARSAFTENGAISIDLAGQDEILNLTQTDLKAHLFRSTGDWRPFFDFFWRREYAAGETEAQVRFEGLPVSDFTVQGINIPANTYSTKAGLAFATWLGQATFTYEYRKAQGQQRQTAGFRIRFK